MKTYRLYFANGKSLDVMAAHASAAAATYVAYSLNQGTLIGQITKVEELS